MGQAYGFQYEIITKNSGVEDVRLFIKDKAILIDSKTFRLGRSQKHLMLRIFKLESVSYWIENCRNEGHEVLGAMVVYTNLHEWITMSESYEQCSVKSTPTIMLPYNYLAYLLNKKTIMIQLISPNFGIMIEFSLKNYLKEIIKNCIGNKLIKKYIELRILTKMN